jgi:hypothetical protein
VFSLNTTHLSGRVDVERDRIRRNGRATNFLDAAVREAARLQAVLKMANGASTEVNLLLLVVHGTHIRVASQPRDAAVLTSGQLVGWLCALPTVLSFAKWQTRCRAATTPTTWTAHKPQRGDCITTPAGTVQVTRWKGFGHVRLYMRGLPRDDLGWMDIRDGSINVNDVADAEVVRTAAAKWLAT